MWRNPDAPAADRQHLQWKSEDTALRHMHKIKLEFGCYKKGYCDGHEREDVIEAHKEYIKTWKSLENRMHLWFQDQTQKWCHVDEFKLKGENSLDRNSLGPFGGNCKIGTEWADNPSDRPLLVIANDESTFKSKKKTQNVGRV